MLLQWLILIYLTSVYNLKKRESLSRVTEKTKKEKKTEEEEVEEDFNCFCIYFKESSIIMGAITSNNGYQE